jgi:hypothetical protein
MMTGAKRGSHRGRLNSQRLEYLHVRYDHLCVSECTILTPNLYHKVRDLGSEVKISPPLLIPVCLV